MEELIHFKVPGTEGSVADFSISREELLWCWENGERAFTKLDGAVVALQDCIIRRYNLYISISAINSSLQDSLIRDPWTTEALAPFAVVVQNRKGASVLLVLSSAMTNGYSEK